MNLSFIQLDDYDASIHRDILSSLIRDNINGVVNPNYNPHIVEICQERAIAEMRAFLDKTYDCDAIFSAKGNDRNPLILMFTLDIAIYHIFTLHNPYKLSDIRKDRYDRALDWLKGVAKGQYTIPNSPRLPQQEAKKNSPWQIDADNIRPTLL